MAEQEPITDWYVNLTVRISDMLPNMNDYMVEDIVADMVDRSPRLEVVEVWDARPAPDRELEEEGEPDESQ